jgi:predicted MFS family arabinose efflux permease
MAEVTLPTGTRSRALRFVVLIGVLSLFADLVYEGSRSILGLYLAVLGAGFFAVGVITGAGELLGYALRLVSGRLADRTRAYWPITIAGYVIQMVAVPLLALAGSWPVAAVLIVAERVGKATRNPPRDVMVSHAGKQIGLGWAFGLKEGLDQLGAMIGPLAMAAILAIRAGDFRLAFGSLAIPAAITLALVGVARIQYPRPHELEVVELEPPQVNTTALPRVFWIYLAAAALVAAGFADFPLIALHFERASVIGTDLIPVLYAVAMGSAGLASLVLGKVFDRTGIGMLVPITVVAAVYAPLVFLGGTWGAVIGAALWGVGLGAHESIVPAAVTPMVSLARRASAYGVFTAGFGIAWLLGSAAIGALLEFASTGAAVAFAIAIQLAAIPLLIQVRRITIATAR